MNQSPGGGGNRAGAAGVAKLPHARSRKQRAFAFMQSFPFQVPSGSLPGVPRHSSLAVAG